MTTPLHSIVRVGRQHAYKLGLVVAITALVSYKTIKVYNVYLDVVHQQAVNHRLLSPICQRGEATWNSKLCKDMYELETTDALAYALSTVLDLHDTRATSKLIHESNPAKISTSRQILLFAISATLTLFIII